MLSRSFTDKLSQYWDDLREYLEKAIGVFGMDGPLTADN